MFGAAHRPLLDCAQGHRDRLLRRSGPVQPLVAERLAVRAWHYLDARDRWHGRGQSRSLSVLVAERWRSWTGPPPAGGGRQPHHPPSARWAAGQQAGVNQVLVPGSYAAVAEAMALGQPLGLRGGGLQALASGGGSWALETGRRQCGGVVPAGFSSWRCTANGLATLLAAAAATGWILPIGLNGAGSKNAPDRAGHGIEACRPDPLVQRGEPRLSATTHPLGGADECVGWTKKQAQSGCLVRAALHDLDRPPRRGRSSSSGFCEALICGPVIGAIPPPPHARQWLVEHHVNVVAHGGDTHGIGDLQADRQLKRNRCAAHCFTITSWRFSVRRPRLGQEFCSAFQPVDCRAFAAAATGP